MTNSFFTPSIAPGPLETTHVSRIPLNLSTDHDSWSSATCGSAGPRYASFALGKRNSTNARRSAPLTKPTKGRRSSGRSPLTTVSSSELDRSTMSQPRSGGQGQPRLISHFICDATHTFIIALQAAKRRPRRSRWAHALSIDRLRRRAAFGAVANLARLEVASPTTKEVLQVRRELSAFLQCISAGQP